jgi:hypothetical protein
MRVLVACEFSGIVRDAFAAKGHDAWSCDLLPSERPGQHIQGNVLKHLNDGWDLMIAHPPCTYLCNSGVRWLYEEPGRVEKMQHARSFFLKFLEADIDKICIENPIPHKYLFDDSFIPKYDQIIHPWQFGHSEKKSTCLWLKNLPKLVPINFVDNRVNPNRKESVWKEPPSENRSKNRSRTFQGIADAMAEHWGCA